MAKRKSKKSKTKRAIKFFKKTKATISKRLRTFRRTKKKPGSKKNPKIQRIKSIVLKYLRNALISTGLIILCFSFLFEVKVIRTHSNLSVERTYIALIEKWQFNSIRPIVLSNNATVLLFDDTVGMVLANSNNKVFIKNNVLYLDDIPQGELPVNLKNNTSYLLSEGEYLILTDSNNLVVVDVSKLSGEISGFYNISKFNYFLNPHL